MNLILRLETLLDSILIERLPMPDNCSADIYALMTSCWNVNPLSRPTAAQIRLRLDRSIKNEVLSLPRVSSRKLIKNSSIIKLKGLKPQKPTTVKVSPVTSSGDEF